MGVRAEHEGSRPIEALNKYKSLEAKAKHLILKAKRKAKCLASVHKHRPNLSITVAPSHEGMARLS